MDGMTTRTDDQLLLRPAEAARRLGIGRTKLYELMATGDFVR
jgi:predicted DNA-binding transcriptional regulator AlpA